MVKPKLSPKPGSTERLTKLQRGAFCEALAAVVVSEGRAASGTNGGTVADISLILQNTPDHMEAHAGRQNPVEIQMGEYQEVGRVSAWASAIWLAGQGG